MNLSVEVKLKSRPEGRREFGNLPNLRFDLGFDSLDAIDNQVRVLRIGPTDERSGDKRADQSDSEYNQC